MFSQHSHKLAEAIDDPVVLASILKEHKYITGTLLKKLQSAKGESDEEKSIVLVNAIEKYLKSADDESYEHLQKIMAILDEEGGALMNITKKIKKEFIDIPSKENSICFCVIRFDYVVVVYRQYCIVTLYRYHKHNTGSLKWPTR